MNGNDILVYEEKHHERLQDEFINQHQQEYDDFVLEDMNGMKDDNAIEQDKVEAVVEEFFKRRFPDKDIEFEKKCGYFGEWVERFKSGQPERFIDGESLRVWKDMDGGIDG